MDKHFLLLFALVSTALGSCRQTPPPLVEADYRAAIESWRSDRLAALRAPDGWPALVGLFKLDPGKNTFGADPDNDLVFPPHAPGRMGAIFVAPDSIAIKMEKDVSVRIRDSVVQYAALSPDTPMLLEYGSLSWHLIERGGTPLIRLRDTLHPARFQLKQLPYFPIDSEWRIQARFIPFDPPQMLPVRNVLDMDIDQQCDGKLQFEKDGQILEIWVLDGGPEEYFLIFSDQTTGEETYGGGRYMYVPRPDSTGYTTVDFNKAYNPPCVFTKYATCLLPPAQNRLNIAIRAGEKMYGELH